MNPEDPVRDIMRRTMFNLRLIEQQATTNGPYEVTQLVNSSSARWLSALPT
ncbi:MAG: hypothetical protein L0Y44_15540 [Phycisphaerales bacterium]|nr:hypothetical protein [Phycisphaerales bacterium]